MPNLIQALVYLKHTSTLLIAIFLVIQIRGSEITDLSGLHSKSWIDPAPVPVDPTDPRDPRPPSPIPYPEPPLPAPIPILPSVEELIEIIKELEKEIRTMRLKISELETKLDYSRESKSKNKGLQSCNGYLEKLRKAIIKLTKKDEAPELLSKNIDRAFLSRLFQSGFLRSIPPFHDQIKGSLDTKLYCQRKSIDY